ncbi:MAG: RidA family protein [Candidatus Obscuribacterales bacterium]|nr:RidA family protein [Candidatus Obscuribacterales bacterium]
MIKIINTTDAPQAIGPYSQAISANGFVFVSGQIPINPKNSEILRGTVTEQTDQVLRNLQTILKEAGTSLEKVVKTTVYLNSMNDFEEMNKKYGEYFSSTKPARATVEVGRLPKDVGVEIDAVAII